MKLRHVSAVAVLAVLLPFAASALSVDDIQQQINNLLAQVTRLQEQLKLLQTTTPQFACTMEAKICPDGTAVGRTGPNCEFAACPGAGTPPSRICPRILRALNQGTSGSDVKELQMYLGVSETGYFGPQTARAVAAFQADEGLSQVGIVGPQTRAAFARRCGGGGWNQDFSASPTSGAAPLGVNFGVSGITSTDGYTIDFGDGTTDDVRLVGARECFRYPCDTNMYGAYHTYTSNGTYTAKLIYQPSFSCPPGAMCPMMMPMPQTVGTVTITVGRETSNGAPVVTGVDGPASLNVGQTGTWTVHASIANNPNTQLRYSVIWGDEGVFDQIRGLGGIAAPALATSGSFTHAYANAGTYKPMFTVANDIGSAQTSASVTVGDTLACTAMYRLCPAGTHNGGRCGQDCISDNPPSAFSASPMSGGAPLTVNFSGTVPSAGYSIDFGDGTSSGDVRCGHGGCPTSPSSSSVNTSHTYFSAGTYVAKLRQHFTTNAGNCAGVDCNVVGTVTITVGGTTGSSCGLNGMYTNGQAYFLRCPANTACAVDPGWFVCRNGVLVRECTGLACYQQ